MLGLLEPAAPLKSKPLFGVAVVAPPNPPVGAPTPKAFCTVPLEPNALCVVLLLKAFCVGGAELKAFCAGGAELKAFCAGGAELKAFCVGTGALKAFCEDDWVVCPNAEGWVPEVPKALLLVPPNAGELMLDDVPNAFVPNVLDPGFAWVLLEDLPNVKAPVVPVLAVVFGVLKLNAAGCVLDGAGLPNWNVLAGLAEAVAPNWNDVAACCVGCDWLLPNDGAAVVFVWPNTEGADPAGTDCPNTEAWDDVGGCCPNTPVVAMDTDEVVVNGKPPAAVLGAVLPNSEVTGALVAPNPVGAATTVAVVTVPNAWVPPVLKLKAGVAVDNCWLPKAKFEVAFVVDPPVVAVTAWLPGATGKAKDCDEALLTVGMLNAGCVLAAEPNTDVACVTLAATAGPATPNLMDLAAVGAAVVGAAVVGAVLLGAVGCCWPKANAWADAVVLPTNVLWTAPPLNEAGEGAAALLWVLVPSPAALLLVTVLGAAAEATWPNTGVNEYWELVVTGCLLLLIDDLLAAVKPGYWGGAPCGVPVELIWVVPVESDEVERVGVCLKSNVFTVLVSGAAFVELVTDLLEATPSGLLAAAVIVLRAAGNCAWLPNTFCTWSVDRELDKTEVPDLEVSKDTVLVPADPANVDVVVLPTTAEEGNFPKLNAGVAVFDVTAAAVVTAAEACNVKDELLPCGCVLMSTFDLTVKK